MTVTPSVNILVHLAATWTAIAFSQSGCKNNNTDQYVAELKHLMVFTSPNYPLRYDNNVDCLWMIQTKPSYTSDYIVKVTFEEFELEGRSVGSCRYDSLKFYSGLPLESHLLGSYCGTVHPDVIYSTGHKLYVKFQTDLTNVHKGFKFYYTAVKKEEANGICRPPYAGVESRLTGSSGTFFSPDYPAPYPTEATCIWQITVPEGKVVKLTFKNFDVVRLHFSACLEIRDSLNSNGKTIGRRNCGDDDLDLTKSVYSSGRYMFVKFQSRSLVGWNKNGFKASFEAVEPSDPISTLVNPKESCYPGNALNNDLRLSGSLGSFKSPPKYPSSGFSCTWVISVPEEKIVKLFFTKFDLNWRAGECGDHVEVFDGEYTSSKRLEKYCAYQHSTLEGEGVRSSGRYMTVRFKSDYKRLYFEAPNENEGFEAQFEAVKDSGNTGVIIGVVMGVVVLITVGLCIACNSKRKRTLNRETRGDRIPMTTTTTATHRTQPPPPPLPPEATAVNPFPAPEVGYSPVPTAPPPPAYPYPLESPPPYPGGEGAPQYPPPGESYPWLQSSVSTSP